MADRVLTWFIKGVLSQTGVVGSNVSNTYVLDKDYVPEIVHLILKGAPADGAGCKIDINDDSTSIFPDTTRQPVIGQGRTVAEWSTFLSTMLRKGSKITLDIDSVSTTTPGSDLSIELWLKE